MSQDPGAFHRGEMDVVTGLGLEIGLASFDEEVGPGIQPGMIDGDVVGHEIEHQPDALSRQAIAKVRQRRFTAQIGAHLVAPDGKAGPANIFGCEIRNQRRRLVHQPGIRPGQLRPDLTALPNAEQPHPLEAALRQLINSRLRHVGQRGGPAVPHSSLPQPHPGVDLIEQGMIGELGHSISPIDDSRAEGPGQVLLPLEGLFVLPLAICPGAPSFAGWVWPPAGPSLASAHRSPGSRRRRSGPGCRLAPEFERASSTPRRPGCRSSAA